jgi:hypothetical protein
MYWNDLPDVDRFVDLVRREGFGGVYTWCATSDALDWRVHRRIRDGLNGMVSFGRGEEGGSAKGAEDLFV